MTDRQVIIPVSHLDGRWGKQTREKFCSDFVQKILVMDFVANILESAFSLLNLSDLLILFGY